MAQSVCQKADATEILKEKGATTEVVTPHTMKHYMIQYGMECSIQNKHRLSGQANQSTPVEGVADEFSRRLAQHLRTAKMRTLCRMSLNNFGRKM